MLIDAELAPIASQSERWPSNPRGMPTPRRIMPRGIPMSTFAIAPETVTTIAPEAVSTPAATHVAQEARAGLTATPKTLSPWLFYDEAGSDLFEQITELPEYYLTRTERGIFAAHAEEILREAASPEGPHPSGKLTLIELGAGTATKTGLLLAEAVRQQG